VDEIQGFGMSDKVEHQLEGDYSTPSGPGGYTIGKPSEPLGRVPNIALLRTRLANISLVMESASG
jgi:hypothetical protein